MRRVEAYAGWQHSADCRLTQEQKESRAYVLIEEARLRCERLEGAGPQQRFHEVHREVGMAGLLASSKLPSWSRQVLLEAARVRSEAPMRAIAPRHGDPSPTPQPPSTPPQIRGGVDGTGLLAPVPAPPATADAALNCSDEEAQHP